MCEKTLATMTKIFVVIFGGKYPKKDMVGLCKANKYGGMTGLVKCPAITQQRKGMMSNKPLGDV